MVRIFIKLGQVIDPAHPVFDAHQKHCKKFAAIFQNKNTAMNLERSQIFSKTRTQVDYQ